MRDICPVKFYSDEGFVEYKLEINGDDLERPMNLWLYAKCRKYVDPDISEKEQAFEAGRLGAEVTVKGPYDGIPTGS
jgi:hypothetical protein